MENLNLEVIEQKEEFVTLSKNAKAALAYAEGLKLKTDKDQENAIASVDKIIKERKRGEAILKLFVDPLKDQVKKITAIFKPNIDALESAERAIRRALIDYQDLIEKKAEAAKEKTMEKIDAGTITVEQGVKKIEHIKEPEKTVRTEAATVSFTIRPRVEVADESKLPREYMVPDMVKIRTVGLAFHKAGQSPIPGTRIVEDKIPSIRGNQ